MKAFKGLEEIVQQDFPLGKMTTFGIGGNAECFIRPRSEDELRDVLKRCQDNDLTVRVVGRGSNILVDDAGVKGVVVQLDPQKFRKITVTEDLVSAGAAASLSKVISAGARAHLSGMECLVGIPGTVGGAIKMNAGGAFGDIGQNVERVKVMDAYGHTFHREKDGLAFGYRATNISARFIIGVEFRLIPDTERRILKRMKQIWISRKNTQPVAYGSAGCIFKNPRGMSAGALIDQSGLKGAKVGAATVSHKHANYIVVRGKGKSKDVRKLIETVRQKVYERFGTHLELEIEIWS